MISARTPRVAPARSQAELLCLALPAALPAPSLPKVAPRPRGYEAGKRLLDIVLAALLLVATLPLLCLACAAILLTARQSPFFVQRRAGLKGREFSMLKLRSMRDAGAQAEVAPVRPVEVLVPKTPDDARVTPIGRLLRRSSLDELPQLINVLLGQMSLVGPRPGLPVEVARYPSSWRRRLEVKPGLTGLWQVSGRCEVPPRRRVAMDRYYIRHRSFPLDCLILLRTSGAVLFMRGAW